MFEVFGVVQQTFVKVLLRFAILKSRISVMAAIQSFAIGFSRSATVPQSQSIDLV